ncbi:MAG: hypothetical protein O2816_03650 [Planctomycetota bacterium]|nr:hypothetical protein [Planctomycetota bacterium]
MSNERPIEPRPASDQPAPRGGHDFLDLEGELSRRREGRADASADPEADSWLLAGEEPAAPEPAAMIEPLPVEPELLGTSALQPQPLEGQLPPQVVEQQAVQQAEATSPWLMEFDEGSRPAVAPMFAVDPAAQMILNASFCEPEPTSRTVTRAAAKGLVVMGVVVLAIGGIQVSRQTSSLQGLPDQDLAPVESKATVVRATVLERPDSSWSDSAPRAEWERHGVGSTRPVLRPAEPDELAVWARPKEHADTAEPFELEDPVAAPFARPTESHHALAASVTETEPAPTNGVDLDTAERAWLAELADLQAAADQPMDAAVAATASVVSASDAWMLEELRAHPPQLSVHEWSFGPALTSGWRLRHPDLVPQRDEEACVWIEALDPAPIQMSTSIAQVPDWVLAEASENPAVPDAPQPERLADVDELWAGNDLVPFAWTEGIAQPGELEQPEQAQPQELVPTQPDTVASVETFAPSSEIEVMVEQLSQQVGPSSEALVAAQPAVEEAEPVDAQQPGALEQPDEIAQAKTGEQPLAVARVARQVAVEEPGAVEQPVAVEQPLAVAELDPLSASEPADQPVAIEQPEAVVLSEPAPEVAMPDDAQPEAMSGEGSVKDGVAASSPSDLDAEGTWFLGDPIAPDADPRQGRRRQEAHRELAKKRRDPGVTDVAEVANLTGATGAPDGSTASDESEAAPLEVAPAELDAAAVAGAPSAAAETTETPTEESTSHEREASSRGDVVAVADEAEVEAPTVEQARSEESSVAVEVSEESLPDGNLLEPQAPNEGAVATVEAPEPGPVFVAGPEMTLFEDDAPSVDLADLADPDAIVAPEIETEPVPELDLPKAPSRLLVSRRGMFEMYGEFLRTGDVPSDAHAPLERGAMAHPRGPAAHVDGPRVAGNGSAVLPGDEAMFQLTHDGAGPSSDPNADVDSPVEEARVVGSGALRRIDSKDRWDSAEVPMQALSGESRLLTPNVGDVIVTFKNGSTMAGSLHAVGAGKGWLDTSSGRVSFSSDRVEDIERSSGGLGPAQKVTVLTSGGAFVGKELARDGNKVTIETEDGLRMSLTALEINPYQAQRERVGIKRRGE